MAIAFLAAFFTEVPGQRGFYRKRTPVMVATIQLCDASYSLAGTTRMIRTGVPG
jgi:hypothetical protein